MAQGFLVLLASIALFTGGFWRRLPAIGLPARIRNWMVWAAVGIFGQLLLGAAMRHQHSGLAVPDFPLAYGQLYPPTDPDFLHRINQTHADVTLTPLQIHLHMAHRMGAFCLLILSGWITIRAVRAASDAPVLRKSVLAWQGLIWIQAILGASTVWTGKAADIATFHVVVGALALVGSVLLALVAHRLAQPAAEASSKHLALGGAPSSTSVPSSRPRPLAEVAPTR